MAEHQLPEGFRRVEIPTPALVRATADMGDGIDEAAIDTDVFDADIPDADGDSCGRDACLAVSVLV